MTDQIQTSLLYPISQAARQSGYAEATLRDLDRRGIVCPRRDASGRRLYTAVEIERLRAHREKNEAA
jgi:DNA-binding transcriptional MerR regulator